MAGSAPKPGLLESGVPSTSWKDVMAARALHASSAAIGGGAHDWPGKGPCLRLDKFLRRAKQETDGDAQKHLPTQDPIPGADSQASAAHADVHVHISYRVCVDIVAILAAILGPRRAGGKWQRDTRRGGWDIQYYTEYVCTYLCSCK